MHRFAKFLLGGGVFLGAAAVVWHPVVVPRVVKFPTDVDRTYHYAGNMVSFVDPATGAALAAPLSVPLTIDREVASVPGQSGAHVAVVKETITVRTGDRTIVQDNVYAIDRRSMRNVDDPKAYTFVAGNAIDRSGTYYLTLPMGLAPSGESLSVWKPEAGASYPLASTTPATGTEGGTKVVYLQGTIPSPLPAPSYEVAALQAQGFPQQLPAGALAGQLSAAGVNIAGVTPVLLANLDATELKSVTDALSSPVPLRYYVYGHGVTAVEPTTGELVALSGVIDGVSVKPDLTVFGPALSALGHHADVPAIASLIDVVGKIAATGPQPVYEMQYTQTPASVTASAATARSDARSVRLMTRTIPTGLVVLGALAMVAGVLIVVLQRRRPRHATPLPTANPNTPELHEHTAR